MTLKKTDLARRLQLKIDGQMKGTAVPGRFGQPAGAPPDRKAQRKADAAAGLVPFACKLPAALVASLQAAALAGDTPVQALVIDLLEQGLAARDTGRG